MRRPTTMAAPTGATLAALLMLSACSGDDSAPEENGDGGDDPHAEGDQGVEEAAEEQEEFTTLEVGDPFGEASWGADDVDSIVAVTADRVVAEQGSELVAWDTEGQEVWSESLAGEGAGDGGGEDDDDVETEAAPEDGAEEGGGDDGMGGDRGLPEGVEVRHVGPETVAVIVTAEAEGEGLDVDTFTTTVTLHDISDGSVTSEHEIEGDEEAGPSLGEHGLGFVLPDGDGLAITPDGEEHPVDDYSTESVLADAPVIETPIGTVGGTVFWSTDQGADEDLGYATDTWSTNDFYPDDYVISGFVGSVDQQHETVVVSARSDGDTPPSWVDAETGDVLAELDEGFDGESLVYSPNGEYGVSGSAIVSGTDIESVGGGEGEQGVGLTAITDDGTAYGISEGDLVVVPHGEEPEVLDLPEDAEAPIAFLEGDLAVHYESEESVLNVNPVA